MPTVSARVLTLLGIWAAAGCAGPGRATRVEPAKAFLAVSIGPRQATWTRNFNPFLPSALFPAAGGIYEPLLVYNRLKAAYVPWLATSYAWSADNTRLAFAIRAGVQWSDLCVGSSLRGPTPYHFYRGLMGGEATVPIGELAYENYGRFASREVDETLRKFEATTDGDTRTLLNKRIQALFVESAPALPLFPGPSWGEYTSARFTGFPDESNPYARLAPHDDPEPLLVMLELKPRLD